MKEIAFALMLLLMLGLSYAFVPAGGAARSLAKAADASTHVTGLRVPSPRVRANKWLSTSGRPSGLALQVGRRDRGPRGPRQPKDDVIQVEGRVTESLPNAMFRCEIEPSKNVILATISGKIRKNSVRIVVGDKVLIELSAYDLTKGRITYRTK